MSEELPELPHDPQLVGRMVVERLTEKGALDVPCPACRAENAWTVEERQALLAHLRDDGTVAYDAREGRVDRDRGRLRVVHELRVHPHAPSARAAARLTLLRGPAGSGPAPTA